jgi:hypothetical protein
MISMLMAQGCIKMATNVNDIQDNNLEAFVNHDDENINQETLIRREQAAQFRQSLKDTYTEMFGGTAGWFKEYFITAGKGLSTPFTIASARRRGKEENTYHCYDEEASHHESAQIAGIATYGLGGVAMVLGEGYLIYSSIENKSSDWALGVGAFAAANLVDWLVYEPVRKAWKEARKVRARYRR